MANQAMPSTSSNFIQTPVPPALLAGFWAFSKRQDLSPSVALRVVAHHYVSQAGFETPDYEPRSERRCDFQNWARRRRRLIDTNGIYPVLIARVTPGFKDAFSQYARSREQSAPAALRAIVQQVVASARIEPEELEIPKAPALRSARVATRFSIEEMTELKRQARDFGSVQAWLVALARAHIVPGRPQFTDEALQALYASNRELAAIGRNVNQIARALNLDLQQSGQLRSSANVVDELATLKGRIDAHTQRVLDVFVESTSRWNARG